jgi:hypothetical protein
MPLWRARRWRRKRAVRPISHSWPITHCLFCRIRQSTCCATSAPAVHHARSLDLNEPGNLSQRSSIVGMSPPEASGPGVAKPTQNTSRARDRDGKKGEALDQLQPYITWTLARVAESRALSADTLLLVIAVCLIVILLLIYAWRKSAHRVRRLRRNVVQIEAELATSRTMLEGEIKWRRAAERQGAQAPRVDERPTSETLFEPGAAQP